MSNLVQKCIGTPKFGRLAPQPNEEMAMTKIVEWLLRLK